MDQHLSEICEDPPVMSLIGVGQRGARNLATEAHLIERQLGEDMFNVAQTLTVSELGEGKSQELIPGNL